MVYFKPIKTKKIYEEIIEQIKILIEEGDLKPGDKLLSERELAERLKVSRASVREALVALEMIGIVEIRPGEGTFVRPVDFNNVLRPLSFALIEKKVVLEALELRKILEVDAAGLAAKKASDEQIKSMERVLKRMEDDLNIGGLSDDADFDFHSLIYSGTQNFLLVRLTSAISDTLMHSLSKSRELLYEGESGAAEQLLTEHRRIFKAIKDRNVQEARLAMLNHLERVEKDILQFI